MHGYEPQWLAANGSIERDPAAGNSEGANWGMYRLHCTEVADLHSGRLHIDISTSDDRVLVGNTNVESERARSFGVEIRSGATDPGVRVSHQCIVLAQGLEFIEQRRNRPF